jgi:ethanolamine utilization microcompartment shell protein EutL
MPTDKMDRSENERAADEAIKTALGALLRARELSESAGYGSEVLGPLADAQRDVRYALDTVMGRT